MFENELKPCPCCGGDPLIKEYVEVSPDGFCPRVGYIYCSLCGVRTELYFLDFSDDSKNKQIEVWNRRFDVMEKKR